MTVACSPASGSVFQVGSTTVTCTATDQRQRTDTCAFTVVVTVPPKLNLTTFVAFGDSMTAGEVVSEGSVPGFHVLAIDPGAAYPDCPEVSVDEPIHRAIDYCRKCGPIGNETTSDGTAATVARF